MITAEFLREILIYSPDSGEFHWKKTLSNRAIAGTRAGSLRKDGRWQVRINGQIYFTHRLAWLYVHGTWPDGQVDHKNVQTSDNRIANLRVASPSQNIANTRVRRTNKLGIKGVRKHWSGKYEAYITVNRRQIYLGGFDSSECARKAYAIAAKRYFGSFARAS